MPDNGLFGAAHHMQLLPKSRQVACARRGECIAHLTTASLRQHSVCRHLANAGHLGNVGQMTAPISVLNALQSHRPTFVLKCTTQLPPGEIPLRAMNTLAADAWKCRGQVQLPQECNSVAASASIASGQRVVLLAGTGEDLRGDARALTAACQEMMNAGTRLQEGLASRTLSAWTLGQGRAGYGAPGQLGSHAKVCIMMCRNLLTQSMPPVPHGNVPQWHLPAAAIGQGHAIRPAARAVLELQWCFWAAWPAASERLLPQLFRKPLLSA